MFYKPEIRKSIIARRKQMEAISIFQASKQIASQLIYIPKLIESQHIGYYLPIEGEVDPTLIIQCEEYRYKNFYLPTLNSNDKVLSYYLHTTDKTLIPNKYGILEPDINAKKPFNILNLDLVFVPLVAFDKHCNRVGRGAGYYDKTFSFVKNEIASRPLLVGLAYEFQKIPEIVNSAWDIPMDIIVTEQEVYRRY